MSLRDKQIFKTIYSIIIISTVLFIVYLFSQNKAQKIKKNMIISNGYVYDSKMAHKGGVNIFYSFTVNDKIVYGTKKLSIASNLRNIFLEKSFIVAFSSKDADINEMLILPKDFKKFNIPYPDTLKWINEKIK